MRVWFTDRSSEMIRTQPSTGKSAKKTEKSPSYQRELFSHSNWRQIKPFLNPVFLVCHGLETSQSYHTHSAADGTLASVWSVLGQAHHEGNKRPISSKAWEWLWFIRGEETACDQGGSTGCVASRKGKKKRWFSSTSLALLARSLGLWQRLRSLWDWR